MGAMAARLRSAIAARSDVSIAELDQLESDLHIRCLGYGKNREMVEALKRTHCSFVIGKHIQVALAQRPQADPFMDEHLPIIEALCRRDGRGAANAMRRHLDLTQEKLARWFEAFRALNLMSQVPYIV